MLDVEKVEEWRGLLGADNSAASAFYFEHLLLPVVEKILSREQPEFPKCRLLFSLMGFSPETVVPPVDNFMTGLR